MRFGSTISHGGPRQTASVGVAGCQCALRALVVVVALVFGLPVASAVAAAAADGGERPLERRAQGVSTVAREAPEQARADVQTPGAVERTTQHAGAQPSGTGAGEHGTALAPRRDSRGAVDAGAQAARHGASGDDSGVVHAAALDARPALSGEDAGSARAAQTANGEQPSGEHDDAPRGATVGSAAGARDRDEQRSRGPRLAVGSDRETAGRAAGATTRADADARAKVEAAGAQSSLSAASQPARARHDGASQTLPRRDTPATNEPAVGAGHADDDAPDYGGDEQRSRHARVAVERDRETAGRSAGQATRADADARASVHEAGPDTPATNASAVGAGHADDDDAPDYGGDEQRSRHARVAVERDRETAGRSAGQATRADADARAQVEDAWHESSLSAASRPARARHDGASRTAPWRDTPATNASVVDGGHAEDDGAAGQDAALRARAKAPAPHAPPSDRAPAVSSSQASGPGMLERTIGRSAAARPFARARSFGASSAGLYAQRVSFTGTTAALPGAAGASQRADHGESSGRTRVARDRVPAAPAPSPVGSVDLGTPTTAVASGSGGASDGSPVAGGLDAWLFAASRVWTVLHERAHVARSILWAARVERPG